MTSLVKNIIAGVLAVAAILGVAALFVDVTRNKGDGGDGDNLRWCAALRVLHQIPEKLLMLRKLSSSKVLFSFLSNMSINFLLKIY